jgi:hypothetical protein
LRPAPSARRALKDFAQSLQHAATVSITVDNEFVSKAMGRGLTQYRVVGTSSVQMGGCGINVLNVEVLFALADVREQIRVVALLILHELV